MANLPLPFGTDGATPIRTESKDWRHLAMNQTWLGGDAAGRYVANIRDYVEDTDMHITYVVTALSNLYIPTLLRITPKPVADQDSEDLLLGPDRGTFRAMIDKSVMPHRLQVDGRAYVNARNAATARVYRGNPIYGKEEIISLVLDQAGNPIGTSIPLQLCVIPNGQNVAQYYVPTAYTTTDIKDGDFLYVVLFDDTGVPLSSKSLRAVVTSFIRSPDLSIKAVTGISMEGGLMSKSIPNRLEIPLNMTLNSLNLMGVVNYNSGAPNRLAVDGQRFKLLGLESFVPTQAGEHFPMHLSYQLAAGEVSFRGGAVGNSRFINEPIDVVTVDVENQMTVKLYPCPEWLGPILGYRLRWFMLNLDRNIAYDVTGVVEVGSDAPAFDPNLYGTRQQLTVVVDLSRVNGSWRQYRFPQTVGITLLKRGDQDETRWRIAFDPNQVPEFGVGTTMRTRFVNQNIYEVDITGGFPTKAEWLKAYYYNTRPLINPSLENDPIYPTHILLANATGTQQIKMNVDDCWNKRFTTTIPFADNDTWYLHFLKQGPTSDLLLSLAPLVNDVVVSW